MGNEEYAGLFRGADAVVRYRRKFLSRLDRLRHAREVEILSKYAQGDMFDCTIGVGRFIGKLPRVTSYSGMDLSAEFVSHVAMEFPKVRVTQGDLASGINEPDNLFDCVLCLRSLSAIGRLDIILHEMSRIARPGGILILDYGRHAQVTEIAGKLVEVDNESLDGAVSGLDTFEIERIHVDAVLTRMKRSYPVAMLLESWVGSCIPDFVLRKLDELLAPWLWERQILVLRKRSGS